MKVGFRLKGEAEATVDFAIGREDEGAGKQLQELGRARFVVFVRLILSAELVGVGHEVVDSTLLDIGFGCGQRPVVDREEAAKRAIGCLDDGFFPEVTACAIGAFLGEVGEVWLPWPSCDFIRGHFFDEAGLLRVGEGGKQGQGDNDTSKLRMQSCPALD
jgi:hypothetical protein